MAAKIYRGYDIDALWAQYNNRGLVPPEVRKAAQNDRIRQSNAVRASAIHKHFDIRYGPHARERLDLFLPKIDGVPLHVYIHGGYWQKNNKEGYAFMAETFISAGVAVAVVEYGLCPDVTLAALTNQIRRALMFLWQKADTYGYDQGNIQVCGHSAGGHLTAMMMATDWPAFADGLPMDVVASGLPISGIYDLEPIRHTPLNDAVGLDADDIGPLSPMFLAPTTKAPMTVVVGSAESKEFNRQAADFAEAWRSHGVDVHLIVVAGMNHYTVLTQIANSSSEIFTAAMGLMGK